MNETFYLVDNNVLGKLTPVQRATPFFTEHCRVPDEVMDEAGPARAAALRAVRYPTTGNVLRALQAVMATVEPGDITLVNLYRNKGGADPLLVASAIVEHQKVADMLIRPEWVIATDDDAVRRKAEEFGIRWMSSADLAGVLSRGSA
ncbi:hypothetical protein LJR045_002050 [Microbacterium sp. LjRoot45]|uniref:hypothetical protein n=1 Tax=Microbacterium sp. LjRoot45 TaxID=3342329 RepID=UPI003ECDCB32